MRHLIINCCLVPCWVLTNSLRAAGEHQKAPAEAGEDFPWRGGPRPRSRHDPARPGRQRRRRAGQQLPLPQRSPGAAVLRALHRQPPVPRPAPRPGAAGRLPAPHLMGASRGAGARSAGPPPRSCPLPGRGGTTCRCRLSRARPGAHVCRSTARPEGSESGRRAPRHVAPIRAPRGRGRPGGEGAGGQTPPSPPTLRTQPRRGPVLASSSHFGSSMRGDAPQRSINDLSVTEPLVPAPRRPGPRGEELPAGACGRQRREGQRCAVLPPGGAAGSPGRWVNPEPAALAAAPPPLTRGSGGTTATGGKRPAFSGSKHTSRNARLQRSRML